MRILTALLGYLSVLAACQPPYAHPPPILLFAGAGTSPNDVHAFEVILRERALLYTTANSGQLDAMTAAQLRTFRLLIVPGGNFETMGNGLRHGTSAKVRDAVRDGLNYLGACAGAFIAGDSPYNGFNLTAGTRFGFYSAESHGVRKAALPIAVVGAPSLDQYWEDGPQLSGWGAVVGKYPDGTPAIVQGHVGRGWVVLAGIHAEAPANWRGNLIFDTPAQVDNDYAATLIDSALQGAPLPHF